MRDVKSLAAELEAVLMRDLAFTIRQVPGGGYNVHVDVRAAVAKLAEIAANQSRAFEDGALSLVAKQAVAAMRHRYEHFDQQAALADCRDYELGYHSGIRTALQAVNLWDAAPSLQPEGERSDA